MDPWVFACLCLPRLDLWGEEGQAGRGGDYLHCKNIEPG